MSTMLQSGLNVDDIITVEDSELIVAFLGLRASNDASKVGPYRALSWGISIVILAMIVYNWFLGGTFLDDPFLLIGDVSTCWCAPPSPTW